MQFLLVNIICRRTSYVFENAERVFARVHSFNHFQIAENTQIEHQVIFFEFQVNLCAFFFGHLRQQSTPNLQKKVQVGEMVLVFVRFSYSGH